MDAGNVNAIASWVIWLENDSAVFRNCWKFAGTQKHS